MAGGGSGECRIMHVKFTVEPVFMYKSGPPTIVVMGSKNTREKRNFLKTNER
jgi:hypothetical protein